jgi:hypothetical protein
MPPFLPTRIPCATTNLLLKHSDATLTTYKKKDETLEKHYKHAQHPDKTLTTYVKKQMKP